MKYNWAAIIPIGFLIAFVVVVICISAENNKKEQTCATPYPSVSSTTSSCVQECCKPLCTMPSTVPRVSYHEIIAT